jgi:hypothetical protein
MINMESDNKGFPNDIAIHVIRITAHSKIATKHRTENLVQQFYGDLALQENAITFLQLVPSYSSL